MRFFFEKRPVDMNGSGFGRVALKAGVAKGPSESVLSGGRDTPSGSDREKMCFRGANVRGTGASSSALSGTMSVDMEVVKSFDRGCGWWFGGAGRGNCGCADGLNTSDCVERRRGVWFPEKAWLRGPSTDMRCLILEGAVPGIANSPSNAGFDLERLVPLRCESVDFRREDDFRRGV